MIKEFENYSLLSHNTFGIDVKAARFIEYDTEKELCQLVRNKQITTPCLHIGQGSNLLFLNDYPGTILHSGIKDIDIIGESDFELTIEVGAGVVWDDFVAHCVANGWYGVENLSNIPGEVGAAVVQNIGAYGAELKDAVVYVSFVGADGDVDIYTQRKCNFGYRHSVFKEPHMQNAFVTSVTFVLSKRGPLNLEYGAIRQELAKYPAKTLANMREAIINIRSAKLPDPAVLGNAGSFFMNPVVKKEKFQELQTEYPEMPFYDLGNGQIKIPAAWLIDKSGWKGKALGPAKVYEKQALVLVNTGGATGNDIVALSNKVKASVKEMFGIDLSPEVKFV